MQIKYLGHSAFEIQINNQKILIDPFLISSPNYDTKGVTDIFVTHGHSDHLGSAIEISKTTNARITAVFELANYCAQKGAKINGINLGGWINYPWGRVFATPAFHSNSTPDGNYGGCPCGFIFEIDGKRIYHAGDTCLNSEMKIIGEIYQPEISLLPIGGHFTMDIDQATIAAKWLGSNKILPMHYNTFDLIKINIEDFKKEIKNIGKEPIVLEVGQAY